MNRARAAGQIELTLARWVGQVHALRLQNAAIKVRKAGNDACNSVPNQPVVGAELAPWHAGPIPEHGPGHLGDDPGFAAKFRPGRFQAAACAVDVSNHVFHRQPLRDTIAPVQFAVTQAGQYERLLAGDNMIAIQFGGNHHSQAAASHGLCRIRGVRRGRQ